MTDRAARPRSHRYDGCGSSSTLADSNAVTHLDIDAAGEVTLMTSDGQRYKAIRDHGHGNTAIEARWAAAWDNV